MRLLICANIAINRFLCIIILKIGVKCCSELHKIKFNIYLLSNKVDLKRIAIFVKMKF